MCDIATFVVAVSPDAVLVHEMERETNRLISSSCILCLTPLEELPQGLLLKWEHIIMGWLATNLSLY